MAKSLVKNYVFNPGVGLDDNLRPNATTLITNNKIFLQKEIVAYIQNLIDAGDPDYVGYTYDSAKCERDAEYVIDALIFDLRYGGNEETRRVASRYWNNEVPQIDGSRIPEYEAYQFLRDLINTYILTNTLDPSPEQAIVTQTTTANNGEANTSTRVTTLLNDVVSVIQNGLGSLPALTIGLGRVELLGKVELEDLLLISNVTSNVIMYSFTDPALGVETRFTEGNSENYPRAEQVNNGVTVINFKLNTSSMTNSDKIQIFLENIVQKVRPYDFGTDALERMRVGIPQAMIDADFEYGLQPTKWQAISMQRGYPSYYELPASDIPVSSVVTDASTGTSGVGASLITVTTVSQHGFSQGDPFTIRALASSITGFNRAEGSFIVSSVTASNVFTYFAKSKVGTSNGQVLAQSTTQLRKAGFYTGADIGEPTFTVVNNGSSGSFQTNFLTVPSGSTIITYDGTTPPIGAPLSGTGVATGTQVAGIFDGGRGTGGSVDTVRVDTAVSSGATSIVLTSTSTIAANMAIPDDWTDSTTPPQLVITSVVGTTINLSGPIATNYRGDTEDYFNISINSSRNVAGTATNAEFRVTVEDLGEGNEYTVAGVDVQGSGYLQGDTLLITGDNLGGSTPDHDLYLKVIEVADDSTEGSINIVETLQGDANPAISGPQTYTGLSASQTTNPASTNALINIRRTRGAYSFLSFAIFGSDYFVGERYLIPGTDLGGLSPLNDATFTITERDVSTLSFAGTFTGNAIRGETFDVFATLSVSQATEAELSTGDTVTYSAIPLIEITFANNHGLIPGNSVTTTISSAGTNHELLAGSFFVSTVPSLTKIRYNPRSPGTIDTVTPIEGDVYIRPDSFFSHRPFDGGVQLGTGGPQHGGQSIRQSKKYIRYQSGKGAMYNTGALFAPSFDVRSITASGTASGSIITIITDDEDHSLQAGSTVRIIGVRTTGYDGDYTVNSIVDERTFRVVAITALGNTTAEIGSQCLVSTLTWHGAVVRSGPYDDQNGIFFQYDGNQLSVARRTSTFQVAGTIAIDSDSSLVTGTNTRFLDQLQEGDRVVIRGMTHVVSNIASNTSMTVTPDFRGVSNISGAKIAKVQDLIIPQSEWNLDRCDGTGPSGYNIDITKMQMIGMQFSWYGAGFIDWMFRGSNGDYVFCHRLKGNNLNSEAYMRTGNLPVRYEVLNEGARSRLNGAINNSQDTIVLDDTGEFPSTGTVYIDNEIITYTGKNNTTNTLTGCTRGASLTNFVAGASRTYSAGSAASHNDNQGVVLISCTTSPIISHWGSAYLIDGQFDEDRGYIFSYSETNLEVSTQRQTAFMLRLAPSVSNAVTGDLGEKELLNRAQLLLSSIEITSDGTASGSPILGGIVVEGVLNPDNYPDNPNFITWSGLSGLAQGGQPSFAQVASGGAITFAAAAPTDTNVEWQADMTITGLANDDTVDANGNNRDNFVRIADEDIQSSGLRVGAVCNTVPFNNAVVTSIGSLRNAGNRTVSFDRTATDEETNYNAGDLSLNFTFDTQRTRSVTAFFTKASWEASEANIGTAVSANDTSFPAGTNISNVSLELTFGGTSYYEVTFNNPSSVTLNGDRPTPDEVVLAIGAPEYALPGETVFSFIAQPGESASLMLDQLKELTTTTLGGRGTFPNGPDVLAINVYKVSGAATNANIILRWGEAQA